MPIKFLVLGGVGFLERGGGKCQFCFYGRGDFSDYREVRNSIAVEDSESVSTGVWCVPGFGAGFEIALEPSKLQKEGENPGKGHFHFLHQALVCTKP